MLFKQILINVAARLSAVGTDLYDRHFRRFFIQRTNRIYILPNIDGLVYVILLALILLVAMVEHVRLTYFVLALAAGLFFAGLVFTNYNLSKIHVRAVRCRSGYVGEQACLVLQIENCAARTRYNLKVELPLDAMPKVPVIRTIAQLKPAETNIVEIAVPLSERGKYEAPRVQLSTTFPFGLFRSWSWRQLDMVYFAYPRPAGDLPLPMVGAESEREDVGVSNRSEERSGADFSGHKVYEFGDSLRHVNWRLVARGYDPQVKKFAGGHFRMVRIDLDRLTNISDMELRLCQVAKWIKVCRQNHIPFQIKLCGNEPYVSVIHGNELRACLERLAVWK